MTDRERTLAMREGAETAFRTTVMEGFCPGYAKTEAARLFPLPPVTRRREVVAFGGRYRVNEAGTGLEHSHSSIESWVASEFTRADIERQAAAFTTLLSLLDDPDEEVPE